jgi:DNA-binding transcriptional LysR family regulator
MESENVETIKKMVEIGVGLAALPEDTVRLELERGTLVALPVETGGLSRDLTLLYSEGAWLPAAVRGFVELFPSV